MYVENALGVPIVQPEAVDIGQGARLVVGPGKLGKVLQWTLDLPPGEYRWAIQSIDDSFTNSRFTPLRTFRVLAAEDSDGSDDTDDIVTTPEESVGVTFALDAPFPNPVHTVMDIPYAVPVTSFVRIKVVDLLGRTVAVLFDGSQTKGQYRARWDARRAAPGMYLVRMETPTWHATQTVLRVR